MKNDYHVSFSELNLFNMCRYKWEKIRIQKEMHEPTESMQIGKIGHKWFEFFHQSDNPYLDTENWINRQNLLQEQRDYYIGLLQSITPILENYQFYHKPEILLASEKEFMVKLPGKYQIYERKSNKRTPRGNLYLKMIIDAIIQDDSGIWAIEYKFVNAMYKESYLERHPQAQMYLWGLSRDQIRKELGYKINGLIVIQIKLKPPSKPKVLKNGTLSVNGINTTGYELLKSVNENNLDINDYQDEIDRLNHGLNLELFYRKDIMWLTENQKDSMELNIIENVKTMRDPNKRIYRNFGQHCSYCTLKNSCINEWDKGGDSK